MRIETLPYAKDKVRRLKDLEEIFWLTATKAPQDALEREKFIYKYHRVYVDHWPDDVYYVVDDITEETMGYLLGCRDSIKAIPILEPLLKYYRVFEKHFKKYPVHLHMDVHPKFQSKGVGTFLLGQFRADLEFSKTRGLHIMNDPSERSVAFYRRSGLIFEELKTVDNKNFLFMGMTF